MSTRSRRYRRRSAQSRSVERPTVASGQTDSDNDDDADTLQQAPSAAATEVSASNPILPVEPSGDHVESNVEQHMNVTDSAPQATPTRKRRLGFEGDAPQNKQLRGQSADAVLTQRPGTPRPAATGASDDPDIARFTDVMRRMFEETQRQGTALKNADTEELAVELIKRMRETEPITVDEAKQQKRARGIEAFNLLRDIAQQLHEPPKIAPTRPPTARPSVTDAATSRSSAAESTGSQPAVRSTVADATASQSSAAGSVSHSEQRIVEPPYCAGKPPVLLLPDDDSEPHRNRCNYTGRMRVPTFDGKNWAAFKSVFESVAKHYRWSDAVKALQLKCCIQGEARAALGVVESIDWSYDQLIEHMELRHGRHKSKTEVMNEMDKLYRKPGQSLEQWRDEVISVANTGTLTDAQWKQMTHYSFLRGLSTYGQMQSWVGEHDKVETLASCYEQAKRFEREIGVPSYTARAPVTLAAHTASAPPMTVEMVSTVDAATSAPVTVRQVEASKTDNLADALSSISQKLNKIDKNTYYKRNRGNRGGRGGRGRGWQFGGNRKPDGQDQRQESAQAHSASAERKQE